MNTTTNNYYGPPPAAPPQSGEESGGGGWFSGHRGTWITAGATVVVALITLLGAQLASGKKDGATAASSSGSPTASSSAPPTTASPTASSSPTAAQADGAVQWEGVLVLSAAPGGFKDLDPAQPVSYNHALDQRNDFYGYSGTLRAQNGAKASVWTGSGLPDYAGCANTVDAAGTDEQPVKKDVVLCVRTNEGRVGRLKVTDVDVSTSTVQSEAVVWRLAE